MKREVDQAKEPVSQAKATEPLEKGEREEQASEVLSEESWAGDEGQGETIQALKEALERAKKDAAEKQDLHLRKLAEFENYRRRRDREFGELVRSANRDLISRLIPVLQSFERALNHEHTGEGLEAYRQGVELILTQFKEILGREGLQVIESIGKEFDPHLHEALMQARSKDYGAGVVCEEIERGYRIGDRVIQHAKVAVSMGPPEEKGGEEHGEEG